MMKNVQGVERIHVNVRTNVQDAEIGHALVLTDAQDAEKILVYVLLPPILQMYNTTPLATSTRVLPPTVCRV